MTEMTFVLSHAFRSYMLGYVTRTTTVHDPPTHHPDTHLFGGKPPGARNPLVKDKAFYPDTEASPVEYTSAARFSTVYNVHTPTREAKQIGTERIVEDIVYSNVACPKVLITPEDTNELAARISTLDGTIKQWPSSRPFLQKYLEADRAALSACNRDNVLANGRWMPRAEYERGIDDALKSAAARTTPDAPAAVVQSALETANSGNTDALVTLGNAYRDGVGVPKNLHTAFTAYERAANAGNATGMTRLAIAYHNGDGVMKNLSQAAGWFQKAADAGNAQAMFGLGDLYGDGAGVTKDDAKAAAMFVKSAVAGCPEGMDRLGYALLHGEGIARDPAKAAGWYEAAARAGDTLAMLHIADLLDSARAWRKTRPKPLNGRRRAPGRATRWR